MDTSRTREMALLFGRKWISSLVGIALIAVHINAFGQGQGRPSGVDLRYDTLLKAPERNKSTPGNEFGDQHSLESGSLSFTVVDVHLPGNNELTVEFKRTLNATDERKQTGYTTWGYPGTRLADWDIALPKIQATYDSEAGWITTDATRPTKNCSIAQKQYMTPPPGKFSPNSFPAHTFWSPPTVHFPDGQSRLLVYNESLMPMPASGGPYFWLTADNDIVSCIATIRNRNDASADPKERIFGQGEGYLVRRADGTKYWFDWIALDSKIPSFSSITNTYCSWSCETVSSPVFLEQATLALYATRVEDRFGNWVTYTYSNKTTQLIKLDRIESSDGRRIDISYAGDLIDTVTSHGRSWRYLYGGSSGGSGAGYTILREVQTPDQSSWKYSGDSHPIVYWPYPTTGPEGRCQNLTWTQYVNPDATSSNDTDFEGYTVESPSGARGVFKVGGVMLGRSGVPGACYESGRTVSGGLSFQITAPLYYLGGYKLALTRKKVTGSGLTPMIWRYSYQSDIGFVPMTAGSTRTKVLNPDGSLNTYTYGNTYNSNEGLLLSMTKSFSQQILHSETSTYAIGTVVPGFPKRIGFHSRGDNRTGDTFLRPRMSNVITQQDRNFAWSVDSNCAPGGNSPCLDLYGRPTKITRRSSPTP